MWTVLVLSNRTGPSRSLWHRVCQLKLKLLQSMLGLETVF